MPAAETKRPKKKFSTLLLEVFILLLVTGAAFGMGFFLGGRGTTNVRVINKQAQEEQAKVAELRSERGKLRERVRELEAKEEERGQDDVNLALARHEEEWKRKFNQVRIEAELSKVRRVEELEKEIAFMKMDERMRAEAAEGDDSQVPEGVAEGLTPRARQICAEILSWEGLEPAELEKARAELQSTLGARALVKVKFGSGVYTVGRSDLDSLGVAIEDTQDFSLLLAVGFADTGGDEALNREIGSQRASNTAASLQQFVRRGQIVEAVYLGQTARFGEKAENRTVEIWELRR